MSLPPAFLRLPLAHRGLHDRGAGRIENSRAAVAAAVSAGYGIEIDVRSSADGQAMVFHDDTLERLCERPGRLAEMDADELSSVRLPGSVETVPTLREILSLVAGQAPLLVELKDQTDAFGPTDGRLEQAVAAVLSGYGGQVALMSFNPDIVACLADAAPRVPRGITSDAFRAEEWDGVAPHRLETLRLIDVDAAQACFVSHNWRDLGMARIAALHDRGLPILSWTIRSPAEEATARQAADNVTFEGYLPALH